MEIHHTFDLRIGDGSVTELEITAVIEADPADKSNWFVAKIMIDAIVDGTVPFTLTTIEVDDTHYLYEPMLADLLALRTDHVNAEWAAYRAEVRTIREVA